MISNELLEILCCPQTKLSLKLCPEDTLEEINDKIIGGNLSNVGGDLITNTIENGLITEDRKIVYPIREEIPVLLISEGILTGY